MPFVDSAGIRVFWQELGPADGRPVLVIHGFASNSVANWLDAGWEAPLSEAGIRAILVDLRGHGASDKPLGATQYTLQLFLDDLVAVLDALDIDSVGVLGYSFGSRLGWELAIAHPQRIDGLVLGGFAVGDPLGGFDLAAARARVEHGTDIEEPATANLMRIAELVPGNDIPRLFDLVASQQANPLPAVDADRVPASPVCFVLGERDELGAGVDEFATEVGAEFVSLKARSHASAITARGFKAAAVERLGPTTGRVVDSRTPGTTSVHISQDQSPHRHA